MINVDTAIWQICSHFKGLCDRVVINLKKFLFFLNCRCIYVLHFDTDFAILFC